MRIQLIKGNVCLNYVYLYTLISLNVLSKFEGKHEFRIFDCYLKYCDKYRVEDIWYGGCLKTKNWTE